MSSQAHAGPASECGSFLTECLSPILSIVSPANSLILDSMLSTGPEKKADTSVLDAMPGVDPKEAITPEGGVDPEVLVQSGEPVEMEDSCFAEAAREVFPGLDLDGDGQLSDEDLDAAMKRTDLTPSQAAAVATMKKYAGDLESIADDEFGPENDGISMQDLVQYQAKGEVSKKFRKKVERRYRKGKKRVEDASDELFAEEIPDVNALKQGGIGDCWFLAALGSYCEQDPGKVVDMVDENEDGTYTVTFPNGSSTTVDKPTPGELALYATSGKDGHWATVLEKAHAKIDNEDSILEDDQDQDSIDEGSLLTRGTDVFSEKGESDMDILSLTSKKTTRKKLREAMRDGRAVTAGIVGPSGKREGLPKAHAYLVLHYDAERDVVVMRNPWGHAEHGNDGKNDGTFELSLDEFDRLYSNVSYAQ